ncbi:MULTISPECIES: CerR family C-terminal domain-containing protein [unclassified Achromobacter]|uniref:CerR family C-terminal domain-containing protein n=1 Tax=unclassified Achromobacter TaxID=2626865 RepID=UPI000B51DC62|nr:MULTISPECIES: CerR family C-terminal domain-containing protein [unclassified Achromobacter]OWT72933.1 TetR family transcriptional regulator [Achromobacter sp. HZ34]OWT74151.1 TetR family transcriptional regulator [Achromobacter sp. HZ28]
MIDAKRPRRPAAGGYARGDETRLRIIDAAIERFGEAGFDGASTRDIAQRAGVNAPALQYYFENKEGLYRACAEHIADETLAFFEPVVLNARQVLAENGDAQRLIDAFIRIQETIADKMFTRKREPDPRMFFAREQAGHEPGIASEVLQCRLRKPLNDLCAELLGRLTGSAPDAPENLVRMMSLNGQLLVFHIARRSTLTLFGWTDIDAEKAELIKSTVRAQTRLLLESWNQHARKNGAAV